VPTPGVDITMRDNHLFGNDAGDFGGGVAVDSCGTLTLDGDVIEGNHADGAGGGLWCQLSTVVDGSASISGNTPDQVWCNLCGGCVAR
jgi:hypothetical protein